MDLMFKRYSSPFSLLDNYIANGQLCYFLKNLDVIYRKEETEKVRWEFWLHKIFDKSYNDFITEVENNERNANMTEDEVKTTIEHSLDILNNFNPN